MTVFKANRKFPNPITVTDDTKSHTLALQQVIEALNIGQRRTKEIGSSYVRVQELVDVGLIEIVGNQLKLTNLGTTVAAGGATALSGLTDVNIPTPADGQVLTYDSGTSKWIAMSITEAVQDIVGAMAAAGSNITLTYNDPAGTLTIAVSGLTSSNLSDFSEAVDDRVAALLVAGTGVTLTYNDAANTLTVAASGTVGYPNQLGYAGIV